MAEHITRLLNAACAADKTYCVIKLTTVGSKKKFITTLFCTLNMQ